MVKNEKAREELRQWLINNSDCECQEGIHGRTYPCGTCLFALLKNIGLNPRQKGEYDEHNDKIDRLNEVGRAILQIRDAK